MRTFFFAMMFANIICASANLTFFVLNHGTLSLVVGLFNLAVSALMWKSAVELVTHPY